MNKSDSPERLLNPFAFPSDTRGRFRMMLMGALAFAWTIGTILIFSSYILAGTDLYEISGLLAGNLTIVARTPTGGTVFELNDADLLAFTREMGAIREGVLFNLSPLILVPALFAITLVLAMYLIYRLYPRYLHWRHKLKPIVADDGLTAEIQQLAQTADLAAIPQLVAHEPLRGSAKGQAFGVEPRYYLRLEAGKLLRLKQPLIFRTLVLHELSHIVNRDIAPSYLSYAIWLSVTLILPLAFVLISYILSFFFPQQPQAQLTIIGFRFLLIFIVILFIWTNLLQIREYYADWRVKLWGYGKPLQQILTREANEPITFLQKLLPFKVHPSLHRRLQILANPEGLFHLSAGLPFSTGILLALALFGFPLMIMSLLLPVLELVEIFFWRAGAQVLQFPAPTGRLLFYGLFLALKILLPLLTFLGILSGLSYLLTNAIGIQVQRATIADLAAGKGLFNRYWQLGKTAVWLTLGLYTGLTFLGITPFASGNLLFLLINLFLFILLFWFWLGLIRAFTEIVLGTRPGHAIPTKAQVVTNIWATISLVFLILPPLSFLIFSLTAGQTLIGSGLTADLGLLNPALFTFINLAVILIIALVYLFMVMTGLLIIYGWRYFRDAPRCPTCGEPTKFGIVVGRECEWCQQPLAAWIYIVNEDII